MKSELIGARILLVDDAMEYIQAAGSILTSKGYRINIARNGKQALEIVEKVPPDLILLDIVMPEMDGLECCRRLKENPATRDLPIIFLSANSLTEDIVTGFRSGAVDYISKPFQALELLSRVHTHLSLRFAHLRFEDLTEKVSHYVSPHVFNAIFTGEKTASIDTVDKPLTIFFSDIVNFTNRAESMGDKEMTRYLNHYFDTMAGIVDKHGGTLDKFIGDSVMVFFGDPQSQGVEADAIAAVRMALEMHAASEQLEIPVRFGLNSGMAAVGNFGSARQMNYTIIGQAVNVASRLESNSEPGRILVSEATLQLIQGHFRYEPRGMIPLKGVEHKLMTYWVHA